MASSFPDYQENVGKRREMTTTHKIVVIGAGSFVFGPSVLHDLIAVHRWAGCDLVLVDVDEA